MLSTVRRLVGERTLVQLRRFATVGTVSGAVQLVLLWVFLDWLGLFYILGAAVAIEITIVLQYVLNNSWTFRPARHRELRSYLVGLVRTNLVRLTAMPIQLAILYGLVALGGVVLGVGAENTLLVLAANAVAIGVAGIYRFYLDSRWTWEAASQGS